MAPHTTCFTIAKGVLMTDAAIGIHRVRLVGALDDHVVEIALLATALVFFLRTDIDLLALHPIVDLCLYLGLIFALLLAAVLCGYLDRL